MARRRVVAIGAPSTCAISMRRLPECATSRMRLSACSARNSAQNAAMRAEEYARGMLTGGTLFEAVYARDKMPEFKAWLKEYRFSHVEISDGTIEIPRERKLELIADFARDFTVLSEVGSKDSDVVFAPSQWGAWIKEEGAPGAWKVTTEAREGGTAVAERRPPLTMGWAGAWPGLFTSASASAATPVNPSPPSANPPPAPKPGGAPRGVGRREHPTLRHAA